MNKQEISLVINRIDELKNLFRFGQKILPQIEDFFEFLSEILPLLEGINQSIADSSSKLPRASRELNKVTAATESATIEILNILDTMSLELGSTAKSIARLNAEKSAFSEEGRAALKNIEDTLTIVNEQTGNITIALQVQDITAQQVATVNHLVESVHERLSKLLEGFGATDSHRSAESDLKRTAEALGFDSDAHWTRSKERQEFADGIIQSVKGKGKDAEIGAQKIADDVSRGNAISQDDINKLFH